MADEEAAWYGATIAKRRLSRRLAAMRHSAGLTLDEAVRGLRWDRVRLEEIESNQWQLADAVLVRDAARLYGASGEEQEELASLALRAQTRAWWRSYEDVYGRDEFPGYEADASRISLYTPLVLPDLLQTRSYAEAHLAASSTQSRAWQQRAAEARLRRQQILDRPHLAPQLAAVITEASLSYQRGTPRERRDQATWLAAMSLRPNIDLRLLRFEDGPHPGMISTITILDFPDEEDPGIVYLATDTGPREVTHPDQARASRDTFLKIRSAALEPAAARRHLEKLATTIS